MAFSAAAAAAAAEAAAASASASASASSLPAETFKCPIYSAEAAAIRDARERKVHEDYPDPTIPIGVGGLGLVRAGLSSNDLKSGAESDYTSDSDKEEALALMMSQMRFKSFEETPLQFVVQFFSDTGQFLWETNTQNYFPAQLAKWHENKCFTPLSVCYDILSKEEMYGDALEEDEDEEEEEEAESAAATAAAGSAKKPVPKEELLDSYVPDTGYCVVVIGLIGPDATLVGYHHERYTFGAKKDDKKHHPLSVDAFRVGEKRLAWREAAGSKRSRTDDTLDVSQSQDTAEEAKDRESPTVTGSSAAAAAAAAAAATAASVSTTVASDETEEVVAPNAKGFEATPTESRDVWNSQESPHHVKLSIARDKKTKNVEQVRLLVHFEIHKIREELKDMFNNPAPFYVETEDSDSDEVID